MRAVVDCHMAGSRRPGDAGNGRYALALAGALARTRGGGDDVWALVTSGDAVASLADGVGHVRVGRGNVHRLVREAPRVLGMLGADAAVFTYVAPPRGGIPVALAVHDVSFVTHPEWLGPRARTVLRRLVPASARRAARVLVLSRTAAGEVAEALGVPEDRIRVVSPHADPVFAPREGAAERVAARHGLGRYCLAVGDLGPRKNLRALAEAVEILGDRGLRLVLVGRAARGSEAVLGRTDVTWLGHVTDAELADLYAAAAVTAFPSLHEGFGLPALEALACGSPLVASDRGALPEVVGDAGILVAPTPAGIAEGLRAALEPATADRLRAAGPARAAGFTAQGMGRAAWDALRECAR